MGLWTATERAQFALDWEAKLGEQQIEWPLNLLAQSAIYELLMREVNSQ